MKNKLEYGPKYFLSALGAGGLAVTFFMYLQFLTPHKTPMATYDTVLDFFMKSELWIQASIALAVIGIAYFGIWHLILVIWNIGKFFAYKKTAQFAQIKTTNDEVDLLGFPLILGMLINVSLILFAIFTPGLWNIVEYIFPLAILAFTAVGIYAFVIYIPFMVRSMIHGFDFEKNNKLGQLKASLTFLMMAVGLAAPVTMSANFYTAGAALVLSIFFLITGLFLLIIHTVWGMESIMRHGLALESSSSLWVPIPIFTLIGVTLTRYMLGMTRVFEMHLPDMSFLLITTIFVALQILFGIIGYFVMKKNNYFTTYLHGKEKHLNEFALVCPGVAGVVMGFFFVHQGLIKFGLFERGSWIHVVFIALLILLQFKTIQTYFIVKKKLL